MNIEFSMEDKRLLVLHLATDPAFQRAVLRMKEGVAASGWDPVAEMPYVMLWKGIEGVIVGTSKASSAAILSKMSELPEYTLVQSNPLVVQEIQALLGQIDMYDPAGGHGHALTTLQRFLDVRVALEAANRHPCDDLTGQANFLQDQLAAVRVTRAPSDYTDFDGALYDKIPLDWMYERSTPHVRALTYYLAAANPKIPNALHFFTARAVIHGLLGKKLTMVNNGTTLYPAFWFVGLADTGMGKTAVRNVLDRSIKNVIARWCGRAPAHPISVADEPIRNLPAGIHTSFIVTPLPRSRVSSPSPSGTPVGISAGCRRTMDSPHPIPVATRRARARSNQRLPRPWLRTGSTSWTVGS